MKKKLPVIKITLIILFALASPARAQVYSFERMLTDPLLRNVNHIEIDKTGSMYVIAAGNLLKLSPTRKLMMKTDGIGDVNDMKTDSRGNVYVVGGYYDKSVYKFDSKGTLLKKFDSGSQVSTWFVGIAIDAEDNVYVADIINHLIRKFDSEGKALATFGINGWKDGQLTNPSKVAVDGNGNVYVVDTDGRRIQKFDSNGQFLFKLNESFRYVSAINTDVQGNMYIADLQAYSVYKFDESGRLILKFGSYGSQDGQFNYLVDIGVDDQHNIYTVEGNDHPNGNYNDRIQKFDATGRLLVNFRYQGYQDGELQAPRGVALDANNNIYVSDIGITYPSNKPIHKYDSSGRLKLKFGSPYTDGQNNRLTDIEVDPKGNIYMIDYFNSQIQKFDSSGRFLLTIGSYGTNDGEFKGPIGIDSDAQGNLYVVDNGTLYNTDNRTLVHRIQKFDSNGRFLFKFGSYGTGKGQFTEPIDIAVDKAGNIYVTDQGRGFPEEHRIHKFDIRGRHLFTINSYIWENATSTFNYPSAITTDDQNNVYVVDSHGYVLKFDLRGKLVTRLSVPGVYQVALDKRGKLYCASLIGIAIFTPDRLQLTDSKSTITGRIYADQNLNCLPDTTEQSLSNIVVVAQPGEHYGITNNDGHYYIQVDTGSYIVSQVINSETSRRIQFSCPASNQSPIIQIKSTDDTTHANFANKTTLLPYLSGNVSSDRRRRCFTSTTIVSYANSGYADAANVKVYVKLPKHVIFKSADKAYTIDKDSNYVFAIGALKANESGSIHITDSVACVANIRGLTACTKVWITPSNNYTLPPDSPWDQSDITLSGKCIENGRIRLVIKNTGQATMADSSEFRILLDAQLALRKNFKLAKGDSLVLRVPAGGKTVRLEADQQQGHPRKSQTNLTIEGCAASVNDVISKGFVDVLPQDDAEPEVSVSCLTIIDSYDPNDKLVSPIGTKTDHYTPTGSELKYTIRFQNTGTDTAYTVVVVDTLSDNLDIASLQLGAASHKYSFNVSGKGRPVLTWTFANINLPDSTRDQQGSNGFVQFSIKPKAGLAEKARIDNFADIFFDYNEPVRTNTTTNVLYDVPRVIDNSVRLNETEVVLSSEQPQWSRQILIYPNPSEGRFTIDVSEAQLPIQALEVYNGLGQKIVSKKLAKPAHMEELDLSEHGAGLYIILFKTTQGNATRKIILK